MELQGLFRLQEMTELKEEIVMGVAQLLGPEMSLDFSKPDECGWLCMAILKYGEEGWMYHGSQSGSNYYRFKVWLLHIEAEIRITYLLSIHAQMHEIEDEKRWYHKKVMQLMDTIKRFDKMN